MNITIKQASIKSDLFLSYEYDEYVNKSKSNIKKNSDAAIHEDLRNAFKSLIPHFAFISDEISEDQCRTRIKSINAELSEEDPLNNYKVSGFNLGKNQEGLTIFGSKKLKSAEYISFSTPFMKTYDDYPFKDELLEAVDTLKSEVYEYLEGKQAPSKQVEAKFPEEEEAAI